ncbi:MAG: group I truncated hemoglobin [Myxococcota bacterium]
MTERTDWERLGGEEGTRAIVEDFVDRMFDDVMIGFLFHGKPRRRIKEMELRLASEQLGGPYSYTGRDLGAVHRRLPLMGGHFARRRRILENTLRDHGAGEDVIERWLGHVDALHDEIMGQDVEDECSHTQQAARLGDGPSDT